MAVMQSFEESTLPGLFSCFPATNHYDHTNEVQSTTDQEALRSHLEALSHALCQAHLTPGPKNDGVLRALCSPDFCWISSPNHPCYIGYSDNLEDHLRNIANFHRRIQEQPGFYLESVTYSASVSRNQSHADVTFLMRTMSGLAKDMSGREIEFGAREGYFVMRWRKNDQNAWECFAIQKLMGDGLTIP
ncbi:Hypothetical predicted protein [Lecanosticta acicola]|uniref:Uncharacterized protein n=1 Tax=Lecanosticta acicola TaxID=111012 RepID=A0AAI8Z1M7_9PEZI|nr:Hypothetical predicted protein [Lecanosticta acicola]